MLKILKGDHKVNLLSRVQLFATAWTIAHQAPPSMEFSRQEYWSGLPFPSPGDLLNPGIKPWSHALWADALPSEPPENMVGVMVVIVTFFKRTYTSTPRLPELLYSVPLTLQQATVYPRLCQRLLDTHRQAWLSLLWGH